MSEKRLDTKVYSLISELVMVGEKHFNLYFWQIAEVDKQYSNLYVRVERDDKIKAKSFDN